MSFGFILALVVLLGGYTLLYTMIRLWSGQPVSFHQTLLGGCA